MLSQTFRDQRIDAVVGLGPQIVQNLDVGLHSKFWSTVETPALVIIGSDDFFWTQPLKNDPGALRVPYDSLSVPRCFAAIEGPQHHAFIDSNSYYPAGHRDPRHHKWINALVLAFLKGTLQNDQQALSWCVYHQLAMEQPADIAQEHENLFLHTESILVKIHDSNRNMEFWSRFTLPVAGGRYSMILFSLYLNGTRDDYLSLVQHWASGGFVVVVPDHEGTPNRNPMDTKEALAHWRSRPQDLIAILDALPDSSLFEQIDTLRIGCGGHLIGSRAAMLTAGGVVFNPLIP